MKFPSLIVTTNVHDIINICNIYPCCDHFIVENIMIHIFWEEETIP